MLNNKTITDFQAILAAAQQKADKQVSKSAVTTDSNIAANKPVHNVAAAAQLLKDKVQQPVQDVQPIPELSNVTFDDLLRVDNSQYISIEQTIERPVYVDYSQLSFALTFNTKPDDATLSILRQYGTYNAYLKCGKGWIFSKKKWDVVKDALKLS